jgi:pyruvate/2-oxoglutarate dehydrogenase complex dihydrolipoamide dehydrogenase (E3) component
MLAGAGGQSLRCSDLLIAAGRRPNVKGLGLEAAGIDHGTEGILINERFATSNSSVSAIGDVTPLPRSTNAAIHQAGLLIRHMLYGAAGDLDLHQIPHVVFTDPELAHVGLTELEARGRGHGIGVLRWPYRDNDRAQAEGEIHGHIKVITDTKGTVLGATLAGAAASEQINAWTLAVRGRLNIRAFAEIAVPYPSYSEIGKRAATTFFTPRLKTSWVRRLLNGLRGFG